MDLFYKGIVYSSIEPIDKPSADVVQFLHGTQSPPVSSHARLVSAVRVGPIQRSA